VAYVVLAVLLLVAVIAVLLGAAHANKVARETGDPEQTTTFWL
jgi:hypothetical protein